MHLKFNHTKAAGYTNRSQVARVLTEHWVHENSYCPNCSAGSLSAFKNNQPVADFYCNQCSEQFELKSKAGQEVGRKIVDGAYSTMIKRINSDKNPHFFFLTYDKLHWTVNNFLIIPKYFFTSNAIEERKPLASHAQRAGWVGCNIDLTKVPKDGRIYIIQNSTIIKKESVCSKWQKTTFLRDKKGKAKGWILDIMHCIDSLTQETFTLKDIYAYENALKSKHPNNNFIKDKIRQQLQLLRDKGVIEFKSHGLYKKILT